VFRPPASRNTGASVVVCPGGGFSILAWDLEGTEVAKWLNDIGVTAIVLKYRVPTRNQDPSWLAPVQDAQRAIRLTRTHAKSWQLDPDKIGILGFSAGGKTAGMAALLDEAQYKSVDKGDEHSFKPNFAVLVYAAWFVNKENTALLEDIEVSEKTPPMFFAHAFDDPIRVENSLHLCLALKKHNVRSELHVYSEGGHGYGLRENGQPVTTWHKRCTEWLRINNWIGRD